MRPVFFILLFSFIAADLCEALTGDGSERPVPDGRTAAASIQQEVLIRPRFPRPSHATNVPTIHRVSPSGKSIQRAIDMAFDGDTVLVDDGVYLENIRFRGKAITVGSYYLIDGDTNHISQTIINGGGSANSDSGSTVYFVNGEDTASVLCGLTIQGGTGTMHHYLFPNNFVWYRLGGGIYCYGSGPRIVRNIIARNSCIGRLSSGGGIVAISESPGTYMIIEENQITDNQIQGDSVQDAWSCRGGGASVRVSARIINNVFERNSATARSSAGGGGLIFAQTKYGPIPSGLIRGNAFRNNSCVTPEGWSNGGGVLIQGAGETTIAGNEVVDNNAGGKATGGGAGGGISVDASFCRLQNNVIVRNSHSDWGGGVFISSIPGGAYLLLIENNTISDNRAGSGPGGLLLLGDGSTPFSAVLENNIVSGNSSGDGNGGITLYYRSTTILINNTIVSNRPAQITAGWGFGGGENLILVNNIVRGDFGNLPDHSTSNPHFYFYNNIQGGVHGEGNIDVDPRFADDSFRLSDSSECIGAGIDSAQVDDRWIHAPAFDIAGSPRPDPPGVHPDMGAREHPLAIGANMSPLLFAPLFCDFQSVRPGSVSDTVSIEVLNRGPAAREITSLSLGGKGFQFSPMPALPLTLYPYSKTSLKLQFSPTVPEKIVRDTLIVGTSDLLLPRAAVILSGRGSGPIQGARSGTLYGIAASSGTVKLYEIERATGRATFASQFSPRPPPGLCAFTVRRRDAKLYAAFSSSNETVLYSLSTAFGDIEPSCSIPVGCVTSMAFSESDMLYMVTSQGRMFRIHDFTLDTVFVGPTGHAFTGLAFSPATGVLWASLHDTLFTVDTASGAAAIVGSNRWGSTRSSITFNALGTMYGLYGTTLTTIGKVWGETSGIGSTGVPELMAIAMRSDVVTESDEGTALPGLSWQLEQNYPNPFNPTTIIGYQVPAPGGSEGPGANRVTLTVYDVLGREVAVLVDEWKPAGIFNVTFDGARLSSGIYMYRLIAGSFVQSRRMILIK